MKATEFLRQDHAAVRRLIDEVIASPDGRQRQELMETLTTTLAIHGQIEEELFYPTLAALSGLIPEARREHAQMMILAASMDRRQPTSPDFVLRLGDLRDAVERHVAEEEGAILPEAERLGADELEAMGRHLEDRKHELLASSVPAGHARRIG